MALAIGDTTSTVTITRQDTMIHITMKTMSAGANDGGDH
jgi:hypothetical protein